MKQKSAFRSRQVLIYICGILAYYLATGLMNDHINILQPYYAETYGWSATAITNPITIASYVAIVMTIVFGILYNKLPVNRVLAGCTFVLGAATIGVGLSGDAVVPYTICLFFVRLMILPLVLGVQSLCTNWFIETRGRAFGIVTMGGPLCSASLVAILTAAVGTALGFRGTYIGLGVIVIACGFLFLFSLKSRPEDCGLYPDGADHPPVVREDAEPAPTMRIVDIFKSLDSWLIVLGIGLLWLPLLGVMAFFVTRMSMVGTSAAIYLPTLTVAALLGVVLSFLVGVVDDKCGTPAAFLLMVVFNLLACFALLFVRENNIALIACAAVGIAGMTGGLQNVQPSIVSYVFGRNNFTVVNSWLYALESAISCLGLPYMSMILDRTGSLDTAYVGHIIMSLLAAVFIIWLWVRHRKPADPLETAKA